MKEKKMESILNTARHMFIRHGIQKTTMEDIARLSRVAKATVYNYFGNKDQVFLEVLNREVFAISSKITSAVEQTGSPLEKLRAFIFTTFLMIKQSADILNLHTGLLEQNIPESAHIIKLLFNKQAEILQTILAEGKKKGVFRKADLTTAHSIIYAIRGIEITWLLNHDDNKMDKDLEGLFNLLCSGILVKGETSCA